MDIFNTLCVFTKEPIREQEIKLECMNEKQHTVLSLINAPPLINAPLTYFQIKLCPISIGRGIWSAYICKWMAGVLCVTSHKVCRGFGH